MRDETYNEDRELDRYILDHFGKFMTELERLGQKSIMAEYKAESAGSSRMVEMLIEKWGSKDNPDVVKALSEGVDIFKRRVRERILIDHESEIFINRCPECNNIVMTPKAQMCLWCNFAWHKDS